MDTKQRIHALATEKLGPGVVLTLGQTLGFRKGIKMLGIRAGSSIHFLGWGKTWKAALEKAFSR
jgi:hypothetical protein